MNLTFQSEILRLIVIVLFVVFNFKKQLRIFKNEKENKIK